MIEIKTKYTRRIDREYTNLLLEGAEVGSGADGKPNTKIIPKNMQLANDFLVKEMTGLSQADIDEMDSIEYGKVLESILALKNVPEKKN